MDGYSHHEQKKLVLQVSKKRGYFTLKGQVKARTGSRGVGWLKNRCMLYICAYVCCHVLPANNIALTMHKKNRIQAFNFFDPTSW